MSLPNFASLTADHPDQALVWNSLAQYFSEYPKRTNVAAKWLLEDYPGLEPDDVVEAFTLLLEQGLAREFFQVAKPDGTLLDAEFSTTGEIPDFVGERDRSHYYPLQELDIVPVYEIGR